MFVVTGVGVMVEGNLLADTAEPPGGFIFRYHRIVIAVSFLRDRSIRGGGNPAIVGRPDISTARQAHFLQLVPLVFPPPRSPFVVVVVVAIIMSPIIATNFELCFYIFPMLRSLRLFGVAASRRFIFECSALNFVAIGFDVGVESCFLANITEPIGSNVVMLAVVIISAIVTVIAIAIARSSSSRFP